MIEDVFLTPAELRVLLLLGEGLKNGEIMERLARTKSTIRSHVKSIYAKVGTSKRLQLILYAMDFTMNNIEFTERIIRNTRVFEGIKLSVKENRGKHQMGHVYFILDRTNNGVKIGWTVNLDRRLKLLR